LRVESRLERQKIGNTGLEKKIASPLRRVEPVRVAYLAFMVSFAASPGSVKGTANCVSVTGNLPGFAPA
jgi:hypothetical protein